MKSHTPYHIIYIYIYVYVYVIVFDGMALLMLCCVLLFDFMWFGSCVITSVLCQWVITSSWWPGALAGNIFWKTVNGTIKLTKQVRTCWNCFIDLPLSRKIYMYAPQSNPIPHPPNPTPCPLPSSMGWGRGMGYLVCLGCIYAYFPRERYMDETIPTYPDLIYRFLETSGHDLFRYVRTCMFCACVFGCLQLTANKSTIC